MGVIAGGGKPRKGGKGLSKEKAKEFLRGIKLADLPNKKKKKEAFKRAVKNSKKKSYA